MNKNKYIDFELIKTGGKTEKFKILNKRQKSMIGLIEWYGPWRQYCFFPNAYTVYNKGCLSTINEFISAIMANRKSSERIIYFCDHCLKPIYDDEKMVIGEDCFLHEHCSEGLKGEW